MLLIAETRIFQVGRYRIVARPLETNPYWALHWIYDRRDKLVGKQLSVPTEDDCRFLERWGGRYADGGAGILTYQQRQAIYHGRNYRIRQRARALRKAA